METLSKELELQLLNQAKAGDINAITSLYNQYKRILTIIITRNQYPANDFDDLFQEASIAFLKAIQKFNPNEQCKFTSYFGKAVEHHIQNQISENRLIRIPHSTRHHNKHYKYANHVTKQLMEARITQASNKPEEISSVAEELQDKYCIFRELEMRESTLLVQAFLKELKPREQLVITKHHLDGLTFTQIAKSVNRSSDTIRRTYNDSMHRLKHLVASMSETMNA